MTIYGRSEELVSRCVECDLAEPESLASLGGSSPGLVDGILSKSVEKAYGEYPLHKLNHVWLTLQSCLNMIIENDGGNDYKIPHMGKESMERRGLLPRVLDITPTANAWLNPTMDDDSDQDSDVLDNDVHVPTTTATPMVEMDGEGGENATTDAITNTGV